MTDIRTTQISVEQFASIIPPQMQATQLAIEQWSGTASINTQMLATQMSVEQWGSVLTRPPRRVQNVRWS